MQVVNEDQTGKRNGSEEKNINNYIGKVISSLSNLFSKIKHFLLSDIQVVKVRNSRINAETTTSNEPDTLNKHPENIISPLTASARTQVFFR